MLGTLVLDFVRQVEAYLTRPHITQAVDGMVGPALLGGRAVVVAHSLGTIVTYRNLRAAAAGRVDVPLLVTLGCPLGIDTVRQRIQPPRPLERPAGVGRWINGTDERDYVALYARLDSSCGWTGVDQNVADIHNSKADAHSIVEYLSDPRVAKAIHAALVAG